jgi:hypothetical protein
MSQWLGRLKSAPRAARAQSGCFERLDPLCCGSGRTGSGNIFFPVADQGVQPTELDASKHPSVNGTRGSDLRDFRA